MVETIIADSIEEINAFEDEFSLVDVAHVICVETQRQTLENLVAHYCGGNKGLETSKVFNYTIFFRFFKNLSFFL